MSVHFCQSEILPLTVPLNVQTCPYCTDKASPLIVSDIEVMTRDEATGLWYAEEVTLECEHESEDNPHTDMPYVNWLPAQLVVLKWVQDNFDFDIDAKARQRRLTPADGIVWPE